MARHPLHDVAIVGLYNPVQARVLPDHTSLSISVDAARGAMADAGLGPADIDGVIDGMAQNLYEVTPQQVVDRMLGAGRRNRRPEPQSQHCAA